MIAIEGNSVSGIATNIRLPGCALMFDIGNAPRESAEISRLFITHGHPDHCGGLINYIFQRYLRRMPVPEIFTHPTLIEPLSAVVKSYSSIYHIDHPVKFIATNCDSRIDIGGGMKIMAQEAFHTIPSHAYSLYRDGSDIPFASYSGDTSIDLLDHCPILYEAEVLILESTFLYEKDEARARQNMHISLHQIAARARFFNNRNIVLTHFSPRYSAGEISAAVSALPENLRMRCIIL